MRIKVLWKLDEPLVVCIGSSLSTSLFNELGFGPRVESAVAGALHDTSKWSSMLQHNVLRDSSGVRYQVLGARRISAVLLVSIEDPVLPFRTRTNRHRLAKRRLMTNPEAAHPLRQEQCDALERIDWNTFPYGPQWETWPTPTIAEWRNSRRIAMRSEPDKTTSLRPRGDGSFDLLLPVEDVTRVLAGSTPLDGLLEQIRGVYADKHLVAHPPLLSAEVIPGDPKQRQPAQLKLTFGGPLETIVQALRAEDTDKG